MKNKHSFLSFLLLMITQTSFGMLSPVESKIAPEVFSVQDNFVCPQMPEATYSYTANGWTDAAGNSIPQPFVKSDETINILADYSGDILGEDIRSTFYVGPGATFSGSLPKFVGAQVIVQGALEQQIPKPMDNSQIYVCDTGRMLFSYDGYSVDSGNQIFNAGTITFTGTLIMNPGTELINYSGASLVVDGFSADFSFQVNGELINYGKIFVNNGNMYLNSSATVTNYCSIYGKQDLIVDNQLTNYGLVLMSGRLELDSGKIINAGITDFGALVIDDSTGSGATFSGQGDNSLIIVRTDAIIRNGAEVSNTKFYDVDDGGGFDSVCQSCTEDIEIVSELTIPEVGVYVDQCGASLNIASGTLSGLVYNDNNGNGTQDNGEQGLQGIVIQVTDSSGKNSDFTTDISGNWITSNLPIGNALVVVSNASLPPGAIRTEGVNGASFTIVEDTNTNTGVHGYTFSDGLGTVTGRVYFDRNGNGNQDDGEPGVESIGVVINSANGEWVGARTDSNGDWVASVNESIVSVRLNADDFPNGAVLTQGTFLAENISVSASNTTDTGSVGFTTAQGTGTLTGIIYNDVNGNGNRDGGEPGLENIAVRVTDLYNSTQTFLTDNGGNWVANGVAASEARISVDRTTLPLGSVLTEGLDTNNVVAVSANATVNAGEIGYISTADAGGLSGLVYNDANANGVRDSGELGLENVIIRVTASDGLTQSIYTDSQGNWATASLPAGEATVTVAETSIRLGSVLTAGTLPTTITVLSGSILDFGALGYAVPNEVGKLTGRIYNDSNGNGIQDANELGIANVWVFIASEGETRADVYTDANGDWAASLVVSRAEISIVPESLPTGAMQTERYADLVEMIPNVTTSAGSAGYTFSSSIAPLEGLVYSDENGNGIRDNDEPGLDNVVINVTPESGAPQSTITGEDGRWFFDAVSVGTAIVDIDNRTLPTGVITTQGIDPAMVNVASNASNDTSINGYYIPLGTLNGLVYADENRNGTQDAQELGLASVSLLITDVDGETTTVTTNRDGQWNAVVLVGMVTITVEQSTLPAGSLITEGRDPNSVMVTANALTNTGALGYTTPPGTGVLSGVIYNDRNANGNQEADELGLASVALILVDSQGIMQTATTNETGSWSANIITGTATIAIDQGTLPEGATLTEGTDPIVVNVIADTTIDAGAVGYNVPPDIGYLYGIVYNDSNGNGTQDQGELGLDSVSVRVIDSEGVAQLTSTTASGSWGITVLAGTATVDIDNTSLPSNMQLTEGLDPKSVSVAADAETNAGTLGYTALPETGILQGLVYDDTNANGTRDSGELGMASVSISILDSEGISQIVTTASDGSWSTEMATGTVIVDIDQASLPLDAQLTEGTNPDVVNIVAGQTTNLGAIGYTIPSVTGTVSGFVYLDTNGNGSQDADELGLGNVTILIKNDIDEMQSVTTDEAGNWAAVVVEGIALISVDQDSLPEDVVLTEGGDPSLVNVMAQSNTNAGVIGYTIPLKRGTLTGIVYSDDDGNGSQNGREAGLANIQLAITDAEGGLQTVTTNATGNWSVNVFEGIALVDIVDATLPAGAQQTEGSDPRSVNVVANINSYAGSDGFKIDAEDSDGDDVVIYNAISPNGDGVNDVMVITGINNFPYTELMIFNRWSQLIYNTLQYGKNTNVFNGRGNNGEVLPSGTYLYIFKFKTNSGEEFTRSGHLYLQR